jgi:hypothetical protein
MSVCMTGNTDFWRNDLFTRTGLPVPGNNLFGANRTTPLHVENEGQRNLAAYGGTEQASKTPTGCLTWLYEPIGGESYLDQNTPIDIRWTWVGTSWRAGNTVTLESTENAGASWAEVGGAASIATSTAATP